MSFSRLLLSLVSMVAPVLVGATDLPAFRTPLNFEPNRGQASQVVRFLARSSRGPLFLTDDGIVLTSPTQAAVHVQLLRSAQTVAAGESPTGGFANYYRSENQKDWLQHIPMFRAVRYPGVYPGIDLVFHGREDRLEFDFEVTGGQVGDILLQVDSPAKVSIDKDGAANIVSGAETWRLLPPQAYQMKSGVKVPVPVSYRLSNDNILGLDTGKFDPSAKLVIDPVVEYSTIRTFNNAVVVGASGFDSNGNLVIAGQAGATDYPVVHGVGRNPNGLSQIFVTKLNPADGSILYSTYLPASSTSIVQALAFDLQGNSYVTGQTNAPDFPVTSSNFGSCGPNLCNAGFVSKLASDGSLAYSTLLASGQVLPRSITVDSNGNAYVAGLAADSSLMTVNAYQSTLSSGSAGFFAKLNPSGTSFIFASYFPVSMATEIALDSTGNIFMAGLSGPDTPLVKPWQWGQGEYFLSEFAPDGRTVLFSTLFGGIGTQQPDGLTGMKIGSDRTIYLAGYTDAVDYPYSVDDATHPVVPGSHMFATAIDPSLTQLKYSLYLGDGIPSAMAIDSRNHIYVTGVRMTYSLAAKNAVVSDVSSGGFFAEIDDTGNLATFSQFGGHVTQQVPTAIAVDATNNIYLAAGLRPQDVVLPLSPDPVLVGPQSGPPLSFSFGSFLAKISPASGPKISLTSPNTKSFDLIVPFLLLRNVGSADLQINNISLGAGLSKQVNNCGAIVPAGGSCVLTVSDANGHLAAGSITLTSNAQPSTQTFSPVLPPGASPGQPIGDWPIFQDVNFVFPPQLSGTSTNTIPLKIWNLGTENSKVDSVITSGDVSQTNDCSTLVSGASCTVQVSLTPVSNVADQLHIVYDTNINSSSHQGTGGFVQDYFVTVFPSSQQILLSTRNVEFGHQLVGGIAIPRVITLTNTGNIAVSAPSVSIQGATEFTVSGSTCTSSLPAHQSCVVGVKFTPTANGDRTATFAVSGGPSATLFATGEIGSLVQIAPLAVDFGAWVISHTLTNDVVLTNTSASAIPITDISISPSDFSQTDDCAGQVVAAGSCTVHIAFTPLHVGSETATMTVSFSGGVLGQSISLSGSGVTPLDVTPVSLDFGSGIAVGGTSPSQGVAIGNGRPIGSQAYTLSLTGDFVISSNPCPNPMPAFIGCAIQVAFQPKSVGPQQGTLTVSYPGLTDQSVVTLTGTGTAAFALQPASGYSSTSTVSAGGTATYNLSVSAATGFHGLVQFTCSDAPQHSTCNLQPVSFDFSTAPSTSLTVTVATASSSSFLKTRASRLFYASILFFPMMILGAHLRRRKTLLGVVIILPLLFWIGCGGGGSSVIPPPPPVVTGTPPGTYIVHVTATSGTQSQTIALTLVVK